jgi:hypothetical protein
MGNENTITLTQPDPDGYNKRGVQIIEQSKAMTVTDDTTMAGAGEMLLSIKTITKNLETEFADPVKKAHEAHKSMVSLRDRAKAPFEEAEKILKKLIGDYLTAVEKKRLEESERIRKEAEAQAEADRIAKAEEQMDKGDLKACEKTLEAPLAPVVAAPVTPEPPKMAGVSSRDEVKFEITDPNAIPRNLCCPDEKKIRNFTKAMGASAVIPGVRIWVEKSVSGRVA